MLEGILKAVFSIGRLESAKAACQMHKFELILKKYDNMVSYLKDGLLKIFLKLILMFFLWITKPPSSTPGIQIESTC